MLPKFTFAALLALFFAVVAVAEPIPFPTPAPTPAPLERRQDGE